MSAIITCLIQQQQQRLWKNIHTKINLYQNRIFFLIFIYHSFTKHWEKKKIYINFVSNRIFSLISRRLFASFPNIFPTTLIIKKYIWKKFYSSGPFPFFSYKFSITLSNSVFSFFFFNFNNFLYSNLPFSCLMIFSFFW